jgi:hypothetical protein
MSNRKIYENELLERFTKNGLNDFYYHMFFDNYIYNGTGNNPEITCDIFLNLINLYKIENKDSNIDIKLNNLIQYYKYSSDIIYSFNFDYNYYSSFIKDILIREKKIFIPAGWLDNNEVGGHAVGIFIEFIPNSTNSKNNSKKYNVTIFNSGEGINNHIKYIENNIENNNIIIKFELNDIQIDDLFILIKQCNSKTKIIREKVLKELDNCKGIITKGIISKDEINIELISNDNDKNSQELYKLHIMCRTTKKKIIILIVLMKNLSYYLKLLKNIENLLKMTIFQNLYNQNFIN